MPQTRRLHAVFDLAMRTGELMLSNGAPAADVTAIVLRIVGASGIRNVSAEVTFNEISLSHLPDEESVPFTRFRAVHNRITDFGRIDQLETVAHQYCTGVLDLADARAAVLSIQHSSRSYSSLLTGGAWGLMSGAAAFMLGAGSLVVIAALLAGGLISVSLDYLSRYRLPIFYQQVFGGFVGAVSAIIVHMIDDTVNSSIVVVACIMMLLAGTTSIGALQDAITGWYVTASARVLETVMLTLGLVVGVQAGIMLATRIGSDISISSEVPVGLASILVMVLTGALISLGFGVGCQLPGRLMLPVAILGGLGNSIAFILSGADFGAMWSVGIGAGVIGMFAVPFARRFRTPAMVFVMSGAVPLVPGATIYRGLLAIIDDVQKGAVYLITAAGIAIAIAGGAVLGQFLATGLSWRFRSATLAFTPVVSAPFTTNRWRRKITKPRVKRQSGPIKDTMAIEVPKAADSQSRPPE